MNPADLRRDYTMAGLDIGDLAPTPIEQFRRWFAEAEGAGIAEPNAMALATVGPGGLPGTRLVLLKGFDENGLVFFTNYESRKGREIAVNPEVSLLFPWVPLERQVIVEGGASRVSAEETADYFAKRPRGSQLGAWVSTQSTVVGSRQEMEDKLRGIEQRFEGKPVPPPPNWGGYRVAPRQWEFWQGRTNRLHDRLRYRLAANATWIIERLAP